MGGSSSGGEGSDERGPFMAWAAKRREFMGVKGEGVPDGLLGSGSAIPLRGRCRSSIALGPRSKVGRGAQKLGHIVTAIGRRVSFRQPAFGSGVMTTWKRK